MVGRPRNRESGNRVRSESGNRVTSRIWTIHFVGPENLRAKFGPQRGVCQIDSPPSPPSCNDNGCSSARERAGAPRNGPANRTRVPRNGPDPGPVGKSDVAHCHGQSHDSDARNFKSQSSGHNRITSSQTQMSRFQVRPCRYPSLLPLDSYVLVHFHVQCAELAL